MIDILKITHKKSEILHLIRSYCVKCLEESTTFWNWFHVIRNTKKETNLINDSQLHLIHKFVYFQKFKKITCGNGFTFYSHILETKNNITFIITKLAMVLCKSFVKYYTEIDIKINSTPKSCSSNDQILNTADKSHTCAFKSNKITMLWTLSELSSYEKWPLTYICTFL